MSDRIVAASDCERCRDGLVAQPVNTASSLAYVAAGAWVWATSRRAGHPALAGSLAIAAIGVGSVAYHGPGGRLGQWMHDAALVATGALALGHTLTDRRSISLSVAAAASVVGGAALAAEPRLGTPAPVVLTAMAAAAVTFRHRWTTPGGREAGALAVLAGAGAVHTLSRTGGPWCRPDSLLQGHALWHVATAAALAQLATNAPVRREAS